MLSQIAGIVTDSVVDGPGLRTVIFFQGCSHHCCGCHNKHAWSQYGGTVMNVNAVLSKVYDARNGKCTISGGEPFDQPLQLKYIVSALKEHNYHVILYTGYTWEYIIEHHDDILQYTDIVVDGKFEQNNLCAHTYKGSANQRIIDVAKTGTSRVPVLHDDN